jgi:hypothetical protein
VLIPHFAHRSLSNCPHGRVSEAIMGARRLLYRFFQARIESGKLPAEIVLEPVLAGLPKNVQVDLLLRRAEKPAVHVVLLERGLKPDFRQQLRGCLGAQGRVFRPVFLRARLQHPEDEQGLFLLDTTQRELRLRSPYDLVPEHRYPEPGTLHFIDPPTATWTTLRGASLVHDPQVFGASRVLVAEMEQLLWSQTYSEWVHEGEAEALKEFREALERKKRQAEEERRKAEARREAERREEAERRRRNSQPVRTIAAARVPANQAPAPPAVPTTPASPEPGTTTPASRYFMRPREVDRQPREREALPAWITGGLPCIGCGQRTTDWQNAEPAQDRCVCRRCFAKGVRLQ